MNIEQIEQWIVYIGASAAVATPVVFGLEKAAKSWLLHAAKTPSKTDDAVAGWLVKACGAFFTALAFVPRISLGLREARRVRDEIRDIERPAS